ncbi:hypothetical protein ASF24_02930 [Methylobacterium sp. Leaf86]|nr:hypothetical protein ASF24_02930 [Methylobacterium sp. Leaf86]
MKWQERVLSEDAATGSKTPLSSVLATNEAAVIVTFHRHKLLSLDDCFYALRVAVSHLIRSSLHRRLQRRGMSR